MAPTFKLSYFGIRGRAEAIRLALFVTETPFEDNRVAKKDWPALKPKTPYGSLPLLQIDSETGAQSQSLLRYVGKVTGLYPSDALAALRVDEVLDALSELGGAMFRYGGSDKDLLREDRARLVNDDVPKLLGGVERRVVAWGEGPFLTGRKMTVADLELTQLVITLRNGALDFVEGGVLDGYPRVVAAYEAVMETPRVAEWYKKHPVLEGVI